MQELRELGVGRALFRIGWEAKMRGASLADWRAPLDMLGLLRVQRLAPVQHTGQLVDLDPGLFADARQVHDYMAASLEPGARVLLKEVSHRAASGVVLSFGRHFIDYGSPIRWHRYPGSNVDVPNTLDWKKAMRAAARVDDIKLLWEVARFAQAFFIARAATLDGGPNADLRALDLQVQDFVRSNPVGKGVHWASSQEVVIRLIAWLFALEVGGSLGADVQMFKTALAQTLYEAGAHIADHINYARYAVYNNHLLSEALGLYLIGCLLPEASEAKGWRERGRMLFDEGVMRQFYADGGYIQNAHNYHRLALQWLNVACRAVTRFEKQDAPEMWTCALARSVDFLYAQQNPSDGRLPNYGNNDGALPMVLSTCDYSDFRPTLQAASVIATGERLYASGPWDEEAVWMVGPQAFEASPLKTRKRYSRSFVVSGYHVLRGQNEENFATFRCGSLKERFSQIDMLHVDVWWRGQNMLVDAGSYLYNGPAYWHHHFFRTGAHNTVSIDGHDQMVHHRRFKTLYWTQARVKVWDYTSQWTLCAGEHYGFQQYDGACIHQRSVLQLGDECWVIVDYVTASDDAAHAMRLHWLLGEFAYQLNVEGAVQMDTPRGAFVLGVYDINARPIALNVAKGVTPDKNNNTSARGWLSRYYADKVPVASVVVERRAKVPMTMITVCGGAPVEFLRVGSRFHVTHQGQTFGFALRQGLIIDLHLEHVEPSVVG